MLGPLARRFGIALLAVSLAASPVLGALPRCCQTGAPVGSGRCCCGPQAVAEESPGCCQQVKRSCCADADDDSQVVPASDPAHALGAAPCNCKAKSQPPALAAGQHRLEQFETPAFELTAPLTDDDASQEALLGSRDLHQAAPPGIALHKVHCRWTV